VPLLKFSRKYHNCSLIPYNNVINQLYIFVYTNSVKLRDQTENLKISVFYVTFSLEIIQHMMFQKARFIIRDIYKKSFLMRVLFLVIDIVHIKSI
jgi:hypothetical protein